MPSNHALLSPSASHRWLVCTPSVLLEAEYGEQGSSSYAQEGTFAHSVAEFKLRGEPELFEPSSEYSFDDTLRELTPYIEYCEALKSVADIWAVETRANLTDIAPDMFGTCDFHAKVGDTLYVVDLKYGKGVQVYADHNPQLMLYGYGIARKTPSITNLKLVIIQPRLDHVSEFDISWADLNAWITNKVKPAAQAALSGAGELIAGKHCKFCKVKGRCRALADEALKIAKHEFAAPTLLSPKELSQILQESELYEDWLTSVKAEALRLLCNGTEVPGYMAAQRLGNRTWANPEEVREILEFAFDPEVFLETKVKTVAQIEKAIGKKDFARLLADKTVRPSGGPSLSVFDPKKTPYTGTSAVEEFAAAQAD